MWGTGHSDTQVVGGPGDRSGLGDSMKNPAASCVCCRTYSLTQLADRIEDRIPADPLVISGGVPIMGVLFCAHNAIPPSYALEAFSCTIPGTVRTYKYPFWTSLIILNPSTPHGNSFSIDRYVSRSTKRNPTIFFPRPTMFLSSSSSRSSS